MKDFIEFVVLFICCLNVVLGYVHPEDEFCRLNGEIYEHGADLGLKVDGCNLCRYYLAKFVCTRQRCELTSDKCQLDGQEYNEKAFIPSKDCEKCYCTNGNVACQGCTS